jgi:hypothetical protein
MPASTPVESKGKKKNASRDVAAAATPRLEDLIDLNLEFDRAVKGLGAAVDETAWCWTRHTLLPFLKSSIDAAARTAQQGAPVVSHKVLAGHFIEAMHGLQATLNGISALSLDTKTKDALTKHALKCLGGNVLNVLVHGIADPVIVASLAPASGAMTADVRTKILMKTNADDSDKVEAANKCPSRSPQTPFVPRNNYVPTFLFIFLLIQICRAVAKGIAADALEAIESAAKCLEFLIKPLDAKAERVVLQKSKDELLGELKSCGPSDSGRTLILGTCLAAAMFTRCSGTHLFSDRNCAVFVTVALLQSLDHHSQKLCDSCPRRACRRCSYVSYLRRSHRCTQGGCILSLSCPDIKPHLHEVLDSSSITIIPPPPNPCCRLWTVLEMLKMLLQQQQFCV